MQKQNYSFASNSKNFRTSLRNNETKIEIESLESIDFSLRKDKNLTKRCCALPYKLTVYI